MRSSLVSLVSWFIYDESGKDMWLTMAATLDGNVATGDFVRATGPPLGNPFDPSRVVRTVVGNGTLTFSDLHAASLAWTVSGKSGTLPLTRTSWAQTMPTSGQHVGRMRLEVTVCPGGVTLNQPITSTYTIAGNAITMVDDFRPVGRKICTMTGTLVPSGNYFKIDGTYSCVANVSNGRWTGTLLVRPPFLLRDEVLTIDNPPSTCIYNQSTVTGPSALQAE
ncbi:MAG TPA: hypothetical protein VNE58_12130 [Casimicrobiaceae bacterium]|nr:hypothetical protein [Casimicrobiaceae bacterium]